MQQNMGKNWKVIDSIINSNKKYYSQILWEECIYVQEKTKTENYVDEDLDSDSNNNETESVIDNDK